MANKRTAIPWRAILLESGFVVFGLVLALSANGWLERRHQAQRAEDAMTAVVGELRANQAAIHDSAEYHGQVIGALRALATERGDDPKAVASWSIFPRGFILPANLASHAWDMASATGSIEQVPYERLLEVSRVYQSQERYQGLLEQVSREIYGALFNEGRDAVRNNWRNHAEVLNALVYRECTLAWDYEATLPALAPDAEPLAVPEYCGNIPRR